MFATVANPWEIEETDFPAHAGPGVKWRFLVAYAVLAPSNRNTQPWRFTIHGDTVELRADSRHAVRIVDPDQRELIISCGAALFHLRLALWHFGYRDVVEIFPDSADPALLARVQMGDTRIATNEEHALFRAMRQRHTDRAPFADRPIPNSVRTDLQMAALSEGAWFHPLAHAERRTIAALVAEGTRQQWADRQFRDELTAWIRPRSARDGLGGYGWGLTPQIIRRFNLGPQTAAHNQHLAETAPLLAVLGTPHDQPEDWVQAGQALARILLLATVNDLAASFLNQPVEVPALRTRVQAIVERSGFPQLIIRVGAGSVKQATPRRMVLEVIE